MGSFHLYLSKYESIFSLPFVTNSTESAELLLQYIENEVGS